ncbi:hypothetical protein HZA71_00425 [Candidatus Falkowbacteria bacterium]|nr:hypothetical protein [Candidatus Falkowbacteria bacterium]
MMDRNTEDRQERSGPLNLDDVFREGYQPGDFSPGDSEIEDAFEEETEEEKEAEQEKQTLRSMMVEELGDDYEERLDVFNSSLNLKESLLIQALLNGGVADKRDSLAGLNIYDVFKFVRLNQESLAEKFEAMAEKIKTSAGESYTDPDTGEEIAITEENHQKFGPRGIWREEWQPVYDAITEKLNNF